MSKWNKIVDYFNKYKNYPEQTIQKLWEQMFSEIFGYSNLDGEIDSQRNVVIGSKERAIPDIIIRLENKDLFVVELKQSNLKCRNDKTYLIDIQIYCKNSTFIDKRSNINFTKWLVKTIKY